MSRHLRSTHQLSEPFSQAPEGLPISWLSLTIRPDAEQQRIDRAQRLAPAFLVPAVLEALSHSPRYQDTTRVVPAEADLACAQHVKNHGGIIVTSDSDLLVHDLGDGCVAFLKDFDIDDTKCMAHIYTPKEICRRIGADSPHRLGYEVFLSRHCTAAQLSQACKGPIVDQISYDEFCKEYLEHETAGTESLLVQQAGALSRLDPRISEMVHQLRSHTTDTPRMFLPILLESPARGTAWEATTSIRQLAYSLCRILYPHSENTVFEYRRVQAFDHKGRGVNILQQSMITEAIESFVSLCKWAKAQAAPDRYWFTLLMTLNIRECQTQGNRSHVLRVLESEPQPRTTKISWDLVHFAAHIEGSFYSLRLLHQVLSLAGDEYWENLLPTTLALAQELHNLPPLAKLPHILQLLELLRESQNSGFIGNLHEVLGLSDETMPKTTVTKVKKKCKKNKKTGKISGNTERVRTNNLFSLLEEA